MINEIQKQTLSDNVYTQLKNSIINGEYKEGNVFPSENFLTIKLKVSRVVVRQALQRIRGKARLLQTHLTIKIPCRLIKVSIIRHLRRPWVLEH